MSSASYEPSWWPPLAAAAVVPTLILAGILCAALGASDAVVVAVIVGPLLLAGVGALLVALGAIGYLLYALWKDSTRRLERRRTPTERVLPQDPRVAPESGGF